MKPERLALVVLVVTVLVAVAALMRSRDSRTEVVTTSATEPAPASATAPSSQLHYALGIVGYNYTEVGIYDYSVNGRGAFNLETSSETTGGGKTVCCFGWAPGAKLPMTVRIEWTRDNKVWCRTKAILTEPGPLEPTTFEVHFYPDRHVEAAITDQHSPPRLKLPTNGGDYRVGDDVNVELAAAIDRDRKVVECRDGRFPIGE